MQTPTHASAWLTAVATVLQARWPTVDPQRLEDLALELWGDERLRSMQPELAAEEWLQPVSAGRGATAPEPRSAIG